MFNFIRFQFIPILILFVTGANENSLMAQTHIEGLHYISKVPVSVEIENGRISSIRYIDKLNGEKNAYYIAPGLFDNQVNGYAGVSFTFGGSDLSKEGVAKATRGLWEKGITSYLPTLTSNSRETLVKNMTILAEAKKDKSLLGSIPGFHLEGPYISPDDGFRGAHPKQHIRLPDWDEFNAFYEAAEKNILTVTLAPELQGADNFIRQCSNLGIVVSLGHHNASKEEVDQAVLSGARTCTHLGNGCANMINRHDNPLWSRRPVEYQYYL